MSTDAGTRGASRWMGTTVLLVAVAWLLFVGGVIALSISGSNDDARPLLTYVGLTVVCPAIVGAIRKPATVRAGLTTWALGSLVAHVLLLPLGAAALAM